MSLWLFINWLTTCQVWFSSFLHVASTLNTYHTVSDMIGDTTAARLCIVLVRFSHNLHLFIIRLKNDCNIRSFPISQPTGISNIVVDWPASSVCIPLDNPVLFWGRAEIALPFSGGSFALKPRQYAFATLYNCTALVGVFAIRSESSAKSDPVERMCFALVWISQLYRAPATISHNGVIWTTKGKTISGILAELANLLQIVWLCCQYLMESAVVRLRYHFAIKLLEHCPKLRLLRNL